MTRERESHVEAYLVENVKRLGGRAYKWVSPQMDGVPDRIVLYRGRVVFVEVKHESGALRPNQRRVHKQIASAGGVVTTVYGIAGAKLFLEALETGAEIGQMYPQAGAKND